VTKLLLDKYIKYKDVYIKKYSFGIGHFKYFEPMILLEQGEYLTFSPKFQQLYQAKRFIDYHTKRGNI
jgi:hypothetical protein